MADERKDPFQYLESFFRTWLEGALLTEIARLLELVGEEIRRRAQKVRL